MKGRGKSANSSIAVDKSMPQLYNTKLTLISYSFAKAGFYRMKKCLGKLAVLLAVAIAVMVGAGAVARADRVPERTRSADLSFDEQGTEENPYHISTAEQFYNIRNNLSAFYILDQDIDLSEYENWMPIGTATENDFSQAFSGVLQGDGHKIYNVKLNADTGYVGLFGYAYNAQINNLCVENISVTAIDNNLSPLYLGGIVAYLNGGAIKDCSTISSRIVCAVNSNGHIGGIAGCLDGDGQISCTYNTSYLQCSAMYNSAGGIVGIVKSGNIDNCYNIGAVACLDGCGGIAGFIVSGSISDCYCVATVGYDKSGAIAGTKVDGVTIEGCYYCSNLNVPVYSDNGSKSSAKALSENQLSQQDEYSSFDFDAVWNFPDNASYPYPQLKSNEMRPIAENSTDFAGGRGMLFSPYLISSSDQLDHVRLYLGACYKLTEDVHLDASTSEGGKFYNGGTGWASIGSSQAPFFGTFNGDGHSISGIHINRPQDNTGIGLFGSVYGSISNLELSGGNITGGQYTGSIAGQITGDVTDCINSCSVTSSAGSGSSYTGGICGVLSKGKMQKCGNTGGITASASESYAGGLVGLSNSPIADSYNLGSVTAKTKADCAGGIAGLTISSVQRCYNTGDILGYYAGGISGKNEDSQAKVENCFDIGSVYGFFTGGISGYLSSGNVTKCYVAANISQSKTSGSIVGDEKDGCSVADCYFLNHGVGGVGKNESSVDPNTNIKELTLQQLEEQDSFVNFSFTDTWSFSANTAYPFPVLSGVSIHVPAENNTDFSSGNGSVYNPYEIRTGVQLDNVRKYLGASYMLCCDVDLSSLDISPAGAFYNGGNGWKPIGLTSSTNAVPFFGYFDGNGYEISGVNINRTSDLYTGLFAVVSGSVRNLSIVDGHIAGGQDTGAICGYCAGTIEYCNNTCSICANSIDTSDNTWAGGITGCSSGYIRSCHNSGSVTANNDLPNNLLYICIGGISGSAGISTQYCYNTGDIGSAATGHCIIGGIAGIGAATYVSDCYNLGSLFASGETGGILGELNDGKLYRCYNAGNYNVAVGASMTGIGGIASANNGHIENCYFIDKTASATAASGFGDDIVAVNVVKLTYAQMHSESSYAGFDFVHIWEIQPSSFPKLRCFDAASNSNPVASITATPRNYNSIYISWKAMPLASKYELYRSTSPATGFKLLTTTASTSYTNKSVTTGLPYYYKVRAYQLVKSKKVYGEYSPVASTQTTLGTPVIKDAAVASYNSVKITWGSVAGRTRYEIWRAVEDGPFTRIATTTSTSYTNRNLATGTTYYYKVVAYRSSGKAYGGYSEVKTAQPLLDAVKTATARRASSTSIKISWSSVAGRTKYEIYVSDAKDGAYVLLGTTTSTIYTDKGLTAGVPRYYKVRAYRTVNGVPQYGGYSLPTGMTP